MSRASSARQVEPTKESTSKTAGSKHKAKADAPVIANPAAPTAPSEKSAGKAKLKRGKTPALVTATESATGLKAAKDDGKAKSKKRHEKASEPLRECFFIFPEADYETLGELKQRALHAGRKVKKSDILRAGLACLAAKSDRAFAAALTGFGKPRELDCAD